MRFTAFLLIVSSWAASVPRAEAQVPDVDIVVFRVDYETNAIVGYYELRHSYRKSLPEVGFERVGDVFVQRIPASDFGATTVVSRLTGQPLFVAETIWNGRGTFIPAAGASLRTDSVFEAVSEAPGSVTPHLLFFGTTTGADAAWAAVAQTDVIGRLAASDDDYHVTVFDHFYTVGLADPTTAEWLVVAQTTPAAPPDASIIDVPWPRSILTCDRDTTPEVVAHNFSDEPRDVDVRVELRSVADGSLVYEATQSKTLEADASETITFPPVRATVGPLTLVASVEPAGATWTDTFADNDDMELDLELTPLPAFRHATAYPENGLPVDFDDDGDYDYFVRGFTPALLENVGAGAYDDVTSRLDVTLPPHPRTVVARDFTGDDETDLLFITFGRAPILAAADGTSFVDRTVEAGLDGVTGYSMAEPLDLEGDGDVDLIFQSHEADGVFQNDGNGVFTDVTAAAGISSGTQTAEIVAADLDADGDSDVVQVRWGNTPRVFMNDGAGAFTSVAGPWDTGSTFGRSGLVFDYDADGDQDILVANSFGDEAAVALYRNEGGASFVDVTASAGLAHSAFRAGAADLDLDGKPELLLHDDGLTLLTLDADGTYRDVSNVLVGPELGIAGEYPMPPVGLFLDLDSDSDTDIHTLSAPFENQGIGGGCDVSPPLPDGGVPADASVPPGHDAGAPPGDAGGMVPVPPSDSGCGCRAAPSPNAAGWMGALCLVVASIWRRKRQRTRS